MSWAGPERSLSGSSASRRRSVAAAVLRRSSRPGFHEMTLRDLAEASGLSRGGLYPYLATENLLRPMILMEAAETAGSVFGDPPEAARAQPRHHPRRLVETHIRLVEAMRPWFVLAVTEMKGFPAPRAGLLAALRGR